MNLTWEQRIDAVVELYHSQGTQDNAFRVRQCEKIMHILNYVHAHKWDEESSVDWNSLLQSMTAWSAAWNNQLMQKATTSPQPDQAFAAFFRSSRSFEVSLFEYASIRCPCSPLGIGAKNFSNSSGNR